MLPDSFYFGALMEKERAVVKKGELPEIKEDEILIKQEACNICTTDYQQWQGKREHQGYPMAGGHECSGIILSKGKHVVESLKIGDQVSIIFDHCGVCDRCKEGEITSCRNIKQFGKNYSDDYFGIFGFANYFIRKSKNVVKIDNNVSPSEAAFVEPLSSVLKGMKRLHIKPGFETVVIIGGGPMGLLNAAVAKAMGAKVIVSERNPEKVKKVEEMGFEVIDASIYEPIAEVFKRTDKKGADTVVVAVGTSSANNQALGMLKERNGKVLFFAAGYPAPSLDVDSNLIHYKEFKIIGTYGSTLVDFQDAANMISEKRIDVEPLVEEKVALSNIQQAFEKASTRGNFRISVMLHE